MSQTKLRISLWDEPLLRAFARALEGPETEVTVTDRRQSEKRLLAGLADVALVPADRAIAAADDFQILPAVAFGAWNTPRATISLRKGFEGRPEQIYCTDPDALEALVSRVVLREHYGISVSPSPLEGPASRASADAVLAVEEAPPTVGGLLLDLGQEWYELTNYPMIWGLFVVRAGEADANVVRLLRDAAAAVESADDLDGTDPGDDGMALPRFRFDDIATASLTELCGFLYYYGVTSDIEEVRTARLPDDADIGFDGREPLL